MPTADGFLDAILANPDDDTPRLAYADWLDEQGDAARAEFIRVQIALARMPEDDERREGLTRRERELLVANAEAWLGEAAQALAGHRDTPLCGRVRFARGMLEGADLTPEGLLEHSASLFRMGPLRDIGLMGIGDRSRETRFASLPWPGSLTTLRLFGCNLAAGGVAELLASPGLANLRALIAYRNRIGPEGVGALTRSPISRLESLGVFEEGIGASGAEALGGWPGLSGVTELRLGFNDIGSVGVEALCSSRHLGSLTRLGVAGNLVSAAGARAVARTERLSELVELHIGSNPLGTEGIVHIARSPHLRRLRRLDLSRTQCGSAGVRALAGSPVLDHLAELDLSENHFGTEGAVALGRSSRPASLKSLLLARNQIGDEGVKALASWPHLAHVEKLTLLGNGLSVFGLKALTRSPNLAALRELDVTWNDLDDRAAQVLARWPGLARLKSLDLSHNPIGDEGAKALAASPYVAGIGSLTLRSELLTKEVILASRAAGPSNVRFHHC